MWWLLLFACRHTPPAPAPAATPATATPAPAATSPVLAAPDAPADPCGPGAQQVGYFNDTGEPICMKLPPPMPAFPTFPLNPPVATPAQGAAPSSDCARDPAREAPVRTGHLGSGSRYVELLNNGTVEIQARILGEDDAPVMPGTLRVPAGSKGRFMVEPGTYSLRYRLHPSCRVVRSEEPVALGARHAGVTIALTPIFVTGDDHEMRAVDEEL